MRVGGTVVGQATPRLRPEANRLDQMSQRPTEGGFGRLVERALDKANKLQEQADAEAEALATGRSADLHRAIITMRQAELSLELTSQVVQRAIEAYKEISRMQV
ncbi:MAG: flagellar hook-basal body complex protein FliE [Armatimonadetes bacterium]|nr:flagellar hook-basal body complex protein FliE [Armatimonadota bacterium]